MEKKVRRLSKTIAENNVVAFNKLRIIADYAPNKEETSKELVTLLFNQMLDAKRMEADAEVKWKAQRANAVDLEWRFHNTMLACKAYVVAQFGPDSNEVESLGLKKKSEYRKSKRKTASTPDKMA
ncbi:MAG: hypothetical protein ACK5RG_12660 [Cyclobacteriaceae bacterium]|jgi:S-adenosylmethionine:tRNA-ribosyltransferase-isomerase (queuine synthetase)|nr:hypothetical protein [Flammeovirgaceae bacterium]